jgi:hypothetical protein
LRVLNVTMRVFNVALQGLNVTMRVLSVALQGFNVTMRGLNVTLRGQEEGMWRQKKGTCARHAPR